MRILHLLNHTRRSNGHVHAAVDLACAQRAIGFTTAVASGGGDFDVTLGKACVRAFFIDHRRSPLALVAGMRKLRRCLKDMRADVVHAHMMTSAVLAWPVCKSLGIPLVTTIHNEFERGAVLMGLGNRVIAVSEAVARSMIARGISAKRIDVILNGTIGSVRKEGLEHTTQTLSSPAIVFVGGLHPRKGIDDLIDAFRLVHKEQPSAKLYIVGDGPGRPDYERKVADTICGSAIEFVGAVNDPFAWMRAADVFVLPSHRDPAPLVLSEAREAGCAIVATQVDGIPEMLDGGEAGILVPPHDPAGLASAIISLVTDPELLREWRERSRKGVERFNIDRVARQTIAVYERAHGRSLPLASSHPELARERPAP